MSNNKFTLENTADAARLRWSECYQKHHFYLNNGHTLWADGEYFEDEHDGDDDDTIELSRPPGERKEDFLLPISYVKKLTPLVVSVLSC